MFLEKAYSFRSFRCHGMAFQKSIALNEIIRTVITVRFQYMCINCHFRILFYISFNPKQVMWLKYLAYNAKLVMVIGLHIVPKSESILVNR